MLLVITALPSGSPSLDDAAARQVAAAVGLSPAEVRMRLAGRLPRALLSRGGGAREWGDATAALRAAGFATLTCDPGAAPSDAERVVGRRVEMTGAGPGGGDRLLVWDGADACHAVRRGDVTLIQSGARITIDRRQVTTEKQRLDPGRAILSGGLILTRKVTSSSTLTSETREPFLLLHRADDSDVILYERRLDYRFLGADMQPSSHANFQRLTARVRGFCPGVAFDERVAQPGFVAGLPPTSADPTDLSLYLVALAHRALTAARPT